MRIKSLALIIIIFLSSLIASFLYADAKPRLIIFYSVACKECTKIKLDFMPKIEQKYKNKIDISYLNIEDMQNYKLLLGYEEKYDKTKKTFPIIFIEGKFLNGESQVKKELEAVILDTLKTKSIVHKEPLPSIDLISRFKSFSILAIITAGLIDGINPCAFTVIVFFISFLALHKYRKREILITGLFFIFAVFLTYFLLGLGLFRVLYSLRLYYFISRLIYILIALLAFALGILTIYDIIKFKKTRQAEDILLKLPQRIKYYIHHIIGSQYRQKEKDNSLRGGFFKLIISAIFTGSFVSLLEAICTGQVYLPTITFVLKIAHLRFQALIYLVLYNLMFIIPLFIIFLLALAGVSSGEFSKFMQRHIITIKIIMAMIFFSLGIFLIWRV